MECCSQRRQGAVSNFWSLGCRGQGTVQMADIAAGVHKDIPTILLVWERKREVEKPGALKSAGESHKGKTQRGDPNSVQSHLCLTSRTHVQNRLKAAQLKEKVLNGELSCCTRQVCSSRPEKKKKKIHL